MNATMRDTKTRSLDSLSDLTNIDFDMDFQTCDKERYVFVVDSTRNVDVSVPIMRMTLKNTRFSRHLSQNCGGIQRIEGSIR